MTSATTRALNHVELVHRPGERELAKRVLELIGCEPVDRGGVWFTSFIATTSDGDDNQQRDWCNNTLYASEVTPEQWAFERTIAAATPERNAYLERLTREPQRSYHFGIRLPDEATLDATCARIAEAGAGDDELAGRIRVAGVFRPGDPDAVADSMVQAFVWTDVIASGLLTLGQHIELQWQLT